jgi:hypothetical protein
MKRAIFAESQGKLYVMVRAVMNPMCAMIDGLPHTYFGKDSTAYLDIETAIHWCEQEGRHHSPTKYKQMIEVMQRAKAQQSAGGAPC